MPDLSDNGPGDLSRKLSRFREELRMTCPALYNEHSNMLLWAVWAIQEQEKTGPTPCFSNEGRTCLTR